MPETITGEQDEFLAREMSPWLEMFDEDLASADVPLSQRPLQALIKMMLSGALEVRNGDQKIEALDIADHAKEPWFKALYAAIERWYINAFGPEAVRSTGKAGLQGVVLIRGVAFAVIVPANRRKVEVEGRQAWMFFEDGLGKGENPSRWIEHSPDLTGLEPGQRAGLQLQLVKIASTLRYVEFRRVSARRDGDEEARKLVLATLIYLQAAARRMASGNSAERGPAWFDLQMANESALKAAIREVTGSHPHKHSLNELLKAAAPHGVVFDANRLSVWPAFREMSEYRYAKGEPGSLGRLYEGYLLTLDLVAAAMALIEPGLKPGFGVLLNYAPWKLGDVNQDV